MDNVDLIHMNGRVYDYNLGRSLSVDPFIQDPGNTQSINPYSYLMNNPLAGTDPSGYTGCDEKGENCDIGDQEFQTLKLTKDNDLLVKTKDGEYFKVTGVSNGRNEGQAAATITSGGSDKKNIGGGRGRQEEGYVSGRYKGDFGINENALREMIADPDTYADALANVAELFNDNELRDILGDRYRKFGVIINHII